MVGSILLPCYIEKYGLLDHIVFYVDADSRKHKQKVRIGTKAFSIETPDKLKTLSFDAVLLISNSKFEPVINYLDSLSTLNMVEGYIMPMMVIEQTDSAVEEVHKFSETEMIPKKIHYCWFGKNEMPQSLIECIMSWKQNCPDFEIIEWNEDNYDVNRHKYTKEAYDQKRYGFVSDIARLDILYENGGIYLDTDVSLIKNLNPLLYQKAFIATEKWGNINSGGGCGFIKGHPMLKKILNFRDSYNFVFPDGTLNLETNGFYETQVFLKSGYLPNNMTQYIEDVTVYPSYVFHPYDYMSCQTLINESTFGIHHFSGGWMDETDQRNRLETQKTYREMIRRINQ